MFSHLLHNSFLHPLHQYTIIPLGLAIGVIFEQHLNFYLFEDVGHLKGTLLLETFKYLDSINEILQ
jgi:hypothetical protein